MGQAIQERVGLGYSLPDLGVLFSTVENDMFGALYHTHYIVRTTYRTEFYKEKVNGLHH